jgi:hypothetical protein
VSTQISATTPPSRPAPRFTGFAAPALAVATTLVVIVGMQVVDAGAGSRSDSINEAAMDSQAYGAGYPLHGGLAGPSRAGRVSTAGVGDHHGPGYPLHDGLAGPSLPSLIDHAGHHGPDYPLHDGLAGPSAIGGGD